MARKHEVSLRGNRCRSVREDKFLLLCSSKLELKP